MKKIGVNIRSKYRGDPPILLIEGQVVHAGLPFPSLDGIKKLISR